MSSEIIEPSLGLSSSDEASNALPRRAAAPPDDSQVELPALTPSPPLGATGTSSADELVLSLGQISPDPFLDEFQPEPAPAPVPERSTGGPQPSAVSARPWARDDLELDVPPSAEVASVSDPPSGVPARAAALDLEPKRPPAAPAGSPHRVPSPGVSPHPSTAESFAALDLGTTSSSKATAPSVPRKKPAAGDPEDSSLDDDFEEDYAPARTNWLSVLHASLTSALALGLIWVLWGHRVARESPPVEPDPFPTAESTADPGHRAGQSRKLVAVDPIPAERIVTLGQTIVIDSLEVTPLAILAGPVILRREIKKGEARRGGNDALMLKLRLKNLSTDSILVPLDEAFIRERKRGIRDSFIEAGQSHQIDMFPLAIVSEWAIAGQDFRELKPGESYETAVVSAPDALGAAAPEMTWRLRLRTDVNQTAVLGVRFQNRDIVKLSPREIPDLPEQREREETPPDPDGSARS